MSGEIVSFRPEETVVFDASRSQSLFITNHSAAPVAFKVKFNGPVGERD